METLGDKKTSKTSKNEQNDFYCELCEKTFHPDSVVYDKSGGKWVYTEEPPRELDAPEILPPRV